MIHDYLLRFAAHLRQSMSIYDCKGSSWLGCQGAIAFDLMLLRLSAISDSACHVCLFWLMCNYLRVSKLSMSSTTVCYYLLRAVVYG